MDGYIRREGSTCDRVDIVNHPDMDLSIEDVVESYAVRLEADEWDAAGFCPVCSSLSRVLHPRVRAAWALWGLPHHELPAMLRGRVKGNIRHG